VDYLLVLQTTGSGEKAKEQVMAETDRQTDTAFSVRMRAVGVYLPAAALAKDNCS
jgi:hypothetical protein